MVALRYKQPAKLFHVRTAAQRENCSIQAVQQKLTNDKEYVETTALSPGLFCFPLHRQICQSLVLIQF